jgi:UDP-N-acetylmuramate dehydrogenase
MNYSEKPLLMEGEVLGRPLGPLTSWRIGGVAERFFSPTDIDKLVKYVCSLSKDVPWTWFGLGSNVLVRDKGVQGAVICTRQLQNLSLQEDGSIFVQAGMTCAKFARFCSRLGYPQASFFAGIPGTMGGALAMNAGAFGSETWEWVEAVQVLNRQGQIFIREPKEYDIGYRTVLSKTVGYGQEAFIGGVFRFPHNKEIDGMKQIRALLQKRAELQPIGTYNCGSVYRNPPNDFAARLIEACSLKGYQVGDAMVSPKHANFIINCKSAKAQEVEQLMGIIESTVYSRFGIQLQTEVKILGSQG